MVMWFTYLSEEEYVEHLAHFATDAPAMNILRFEPLFYTTKEFHGWRNFISLEKYGSIKAFKVCLETTFSAMQQKFQFGTDSSFLEGVQTNKPLFL